LAAESHDRRHLFDAAARVLRYHAAKVELGAARGADPGGRLAGPDAPASSQAAATDAHA
jgi:hypothetical protein